MKRARAFFVTVACAILLSGCFTGLRTSLNQAVQVMVVATITTPMQFVIYSEMYLKANNHWPENLDELKTFASTNEPALGTNAVALFMNCRNADFIALTNGSLKIRYVAVVQTSSLLTNKILIPRPQVDSNGVWHLEGINVQSSSLKMTN